MTKSHEKYTPGPAEIEFHNWANYAGYVPANVIKAYEYEKAIAHAEDRE